MQPGYDPPDFFLRFPVGLFRGLGSIQKYIGNHFDLLLHVVEDQKGIRDHEIAVIKVQVLGKKFRNLLKDLTTS